MISAHSLKIHAPLLKVKCSVKFVDAAVLVHPFTNFSAKFARYYVS